MKLWFVFFFFLSFCAFVQISDGKENSGLKLACEEEANWESRLDSSLLDQSKKKILQILNSGSLKELKTLQLIGDKKAKLILGWREINGGFAQVEKKLMVGINCLKHAAEKSDRVELFCLSPSFLLGGRFEEN